MGVFGGVSPCEVDVFPGEVDGISERDPGRDFVVGFV